MPGSKLFIVPRQPSPRPQVANNLPAESTPLVGRAPEVAAARLLLAEPDVRLLTLLGPGGVGKTRLALRLAHELLEEFEDGVYLVELAPILAADLVLPAIATVLQVREAPPTPLLATVVAHLQSKRMLLVLDNFEQIIAAGPVVAELLTACAGLKLLITSRTALRLRAEREFVLAPLALPEPARHPDLKSLAQYGAVALFVERATVVAPAFALNAANARAVVEVCRRVDGLPLAIELVAAHARLLSPQALLARLTHPLRLLAGGPQDAALRHQTMRDTIAWSYELLSAAEQRLFRRLAVFAGNFALAAAEAVCNDEGAIAIAVDHPAALEVLAALEALVDQSLLRQAEPGADGSPRLAMLETVREFALEQLQDDGEAELLRRRQADYFLWLAQESATGLHGADLALWLDRLDRDHDNLRAVLNWLLEQGDGAATTDALRLIVALDAFWERRVHLRELHNWLAQALAQGGPRADLLRTRAMIMACAAARRMTDFVQANAWGEAALAAAQELGDKWSSATALDALGGVALMQGDYETAGTLSTAALSIYRELEAAHNIALTLNNLGMVAGYKGDFRQAEQIFRESLDLIQAREDKTGQLTPLINLGYALHNQGAQRRARATFVEAIMLIRETDSPRAAGRAFAGLAAAMLAASGAADASSGAQSARQAAQLLAASATLRERGGGHLDPRNQGEFDQNVAAARARLGEAAFGGAWQEGAALTLEQALDLATSHDEPSSAEAAGRSNKQDYGGLTPREVDVTRLIVQGLSNGEIAQRLVLSERTVEMHVSNALRKLELSKRMQLAAWALRQGLGTEQEPA